MDQVIEYFFSSPKKIHRAGVMLFNVGSVLGIAGLVGQLVTTAANFTLSMTSKAAETAQLASIYPDWPLWWVPESLFGAFIAVMFITCGLYLNHLGKQIDRFIG